jgi:hypothetical protein
MIIPGIGKKLSRLFNMVFLIIDFFYFTLKYNSSTI